MTRVIIETDRLILRTVTADDVEEVASSWRLDAGPISREEAGDRIAWMHANHDRNGPGRLVHLCLAILDKDTQEFIGWCGLDHLDPAKENPVLFYLLKASHWGKGLATEAARAVLGYGFGELALARVDGGAASENAASKRVMEKIGMRYLGLNEEGGHSFALTREEYSAPDILPVLIQWARTHSTVRAVLLTSTRARPAASVDALSDYDVILIVQDLHPFVADRRWLNDFGDVLVAYWDPVHPDPAFGVDVCGNVTQYADGLKIDFNLWPVALFQQIVAAPALPAELDAGYRVLLDKDGLSATMRTPSFTAYVPKPPSLETYQTLINDFLSDAPYVAKCLWRDELLPAKWCLESDMKHNYLRQMLEWRVEVDHAWSVPAGFLGRGLKRHLPADIWAQVERTYVGARIADNWAALARTMALFRQVAVEVGEHLGYPYPHELHQRVSAYVDHIRHTVRPASARRHRAPP